MSEDFEQQEYFTVATAITDFDNRLLTIKGWGVTLSLAAVGLGFQYHAYGFFLLSMASSLSFWAIEAVTKRHQMRHYLRMREIEINRYQQCDEASRGNSAPRMSWSWDQANAVFEKGKWPAANEGLQPLGIRRGYRFSYLLPHVALPHAITFLLSGTLFVLGLQGSLQGFALGTIPKL